MRTVFRDSHCRSVVIGNSILKNIVVDLSLPSLLAPHMDGVDAVAVERAVADGHILGRVEPDAVEPGVKDAIFNKNSVNIVSEELNVAHPAPLAVHTVEETVAESEVLGLADPEGLASGRVRQADELKSINSHISGAIDFDRIIEQTGNIKTGFTGDTALDGNAGKIDIHLFSVNTGAHNDRISGARFAESISESAERAGSFGIHLKCHRLMLEVGIDSEIQTLCDHGFFADRVKMAVENIVFAGKKITHDNLSAGESQACFLIGGTAEKAFLCLNASGSHIDIAIVAGSIPADKSAVGTDLLDLQILDLHGLIVFFDRLTADGAAIKSGRCKGAVVRESVVFVELHTGETALVGFFHLALECFQSFV